MHVEHSPAMLLLLDSCLCKFPFPARGHPATAAVPERQHRETCKPRAQERQSWAEPQPQGTAFVPVPTAPSATGHHHHLPSCSRVDSPAGNRPRSLGLEKGCSNPVNWSPGSARLGSFPLLCSTKNFLCCFLRVAFPSEASFL